MTKEEFLKKVEEQRKYIKELREKIRNYMKYRREKYFDEEVKSDSE